MNVKKKKFPFISLGEGFILEFCVSNSGDLYSEGLVFGISRYENFVPRRLFLIIAVGRHWSPGTVGERFSFPNSLSFVFIYADDIQGWQDAVLKSLERKHRAEQEFLINLLQDESSKGMREEARALSEDERLKRLNELKTKREELDFGVKGNL